VTGNQCDQCVDGFYLLTSGGCRECNCDMVRGATSTTCDKSTGQCTCKVSSIYSLVVGAGNVPVGGCRECNCEWVRAGSVTVSVCRECNCEWVQGV